MSQPPPEESSSDFLSQPFDKIQQILSFDGSPYRSLVSYFLKQRTSAESAEHSLESSPESSSNRHSDSDRGLFSQGLYLPNTQPVPAEKETFFMSSVLSNSNNLDAVSLDGGNPTSAAAHPANAGPVPITHFIQNACNSEARTNVNVEPENANLEKTALNSPDVNSQNGAIQLQQQVVQLTAKLEQVVRTQTTLTVENNDLRAKVEAQDKMICEYRGVLRALEGSFKESVLRQTARLDGFEQTYQSDRIQASKMQQAKNDQLEARLEGMVSSMLNAAVEKAIRLVRRDGRRASKPTQVPSTPNLDHLYVTRLHQPNQPQ